MNKLDYFDDIYIINISSLLKVDINDIYIDKLVMSPYKTRLNYIFLKQYL
jgi:hypothetical protein